ncbi:hypothetical protein PQX77_021442 [Marasmius sp. AFHP31]|nr:hypothetical protein PQX77_021442 [Marasmius sp. AFHP31]
MTTAIHTTITTNPTAATSKPVTMTIKPFHADAALFDTDYIIAATHGKRAIDNSQRLHDDMDPYVQEFEESILFFADTYNSHGPGLRRNSFVSTPTRSELFSSSSDSTPPLTSGSSAPFSRPSSIFPKHRVVEPHGSIVEDDVVQMGSKGKEMYHDITSVKVLPGVKKMFDGIPVGRYTVATSGAKTYAHGCMARISIPPYSVSITADDKCLKAGKPAPDPFLLAASCLGDVSYSKIPPQGFVPV